MRVHDSGPGPASRVPAGRVERLVHMGTMAASVAAGAATETARRWWRGDEWSWPEAVVAGLDPTTLAGRLARMRGAAMKLGQLLSMEAGDLLPGPLADALGTLRASGSTMTATQLRRVLAAEYGPAWRERFREFDERPMAAASIGQVHRAVATDGRTLALKIQFPGVAASIDSDVENLAMLLRAASLVPSGVEIRPLLAEVRRQLIRETDYLAEARHLARYRTLVADMPEVIVPAVHDDLTTPRILAMELVEAAPIEVLWTTPAAQAQRDAIAHRVQTIVFRELFEFGLMQSDPNFANYLHTDDGRLVLLDFGATIEVSAGLRERYRRMVEAAVAEDLDGVADLLLEFGWAPASLSRSQLCGLAELVHLSVEPLRWDGPYDYGVGDLSGRARAASLDLALRRGVRHPPPPEMVFVQRKLSGTYLLCAHLGARIDSAGMFRRFMDEDRAWHERSGPAA